MKNLNIETKCPRPFDTITIDKNGNCFACECSGWLPIPVGNLQIQEIDEILQSEKIKQIRQSISDGTYRYCDNNLCSYLLDTRDGIKLWKKENPEILIKNLRLGIDDSCNLSCPSCRTKQIFEKRGTKLKARIKIAKKIIKYLKNTKNNIVVHIGSDGDPFASLVYRYFLKNCPRKDNISFSIQTNGLLIEKMFNKNKWIFKKCLTVGLSIDGCTRDTYSKLRRGGNFEMLCKNLEFLKKIKEHSYFQLIFHCVVQLENYKEMTEYIQFAKKYSADRVWFNRIVDWKTYQNFKNYDVVDTDHDMNNDFKKELSKVKEIAQNDRSTMIEFPTLDIL